MMPRLAILLSCATLWLANAVQYSFVGDSLDNVLTGNGKNNNMRGYGGNDHIDGRAGTDSESGGDGDDALIGGPGNDLLWGGNGNDRLSGGLGSDSLSGGAGNDYMKLGGAGGTEYAHPATGADTIVCGSGVDVIAYISSQLLADTTAGVAPDVITKFDRNMDSIRIFVNTGYTIGDFAGQKDIMLYRGLPALQVVGQNVQSLLDNGIISYFK